MYSDVSLKHSLPPIDALRAAISASRTGSFSAAAEALDVTHGAISRRITMMEQWAGTRLFERHGRGVRSTFEGQQLIAQIEQALAILEDSRLVHFRHSDLDIVRVGMVQSFARLWLVPHLAELEGFPPDLRIEAEIDDRYLTLSEARIAVRLGRGDWPDVVAHRLFSEELIPYAVPSLATEISPHNASTDILKFPLIHDASEVNWRLWMASENIEYERRPKDRVVPSYDIALLIAARGHGIVLVRTPYGQVFAEQLGLVSVVPRGIEHSQAFYVLTKPGTMHPAASRLLKRITSLTYKV
jgi:LysR family transcriptional regulator, glycine cleavage system transcriptional activator